MPTPQVYIPPGSASTQQTQVEGDIKIRVIILWIIGSILTVLVVGGVVGLIMNPVVFSSYWSSVLPIISGAVFGLIGFIVGRNLSP
jgi:hypothetical protein